MTTINRPMRVGMIVALGMLFLGIRSNASAGDFYSSYTDVKVIAHLAWSGTSPQQMFLQQNDTKQYLYLQGPSQQGFTVVDVTKPTKPKMVSHVPQENLTMLSSGLAIAEKSDNSATGGASRATGSTEGTRGGGSVTQSVRVLDVSDPAHPRTIQTFSGVTSVLADDARGLIYVANGEGIWILSHQRVLRRHECSSSDEISPMPNCN
jgi:hypothetical protein